MKYTVRIQGEEHEVELRELPGGAAGAYAARVDGEPIEVTEREIDGLGQTLLVVDGRSYGASVEGAGEDVTVTIAGHVYPVHVEDERERAAHAAERAAHKGGGTLTSVMPGVVVSVLVEPGARVEAGQPLLVLEAMKMQNEIGAPAAGVVSALHVAPGQPVATGAKLVTLDAPD